jgi:HD-GYP domain-containing protein (c-di-GMP phosphodiesterase class II)
MARRLSLPEHEVQTVWWAGTLHDLGKLAVRIEVVRKVGPLDQAEWREIRRHPAAGADLLLAVSSDLAPIATAVRAHHERWDGSGYPEGLSREEIPLLSRVIAIADAFDSMTRRRPYRVKVLAASEAIGEIQDKSGSQFDPALVPLFVELHNNGQIVGR